MAAPASLDQIQQLLVPLTEKPARSQAPLKKLARASEIASQLDPKDGPRIQGVFNEYVASMVQYGCNKKRIERAFDAIADGHPFLLTALLASRADPNVVDKHGYSLLDAVALRGRPEMLQVLIDHGAKATQFKKTLEELLAMAKEQQQVREPA